MTPADAEINECLRTARSFIVGAQKIMQREGGYDRERDWCIAAETNLTLALQSIAAAAERGSDEDEAEEEQ